MRIHPWLAALSSLCLLIAAGESSARAQQASSAVYESGGFDDALAGRVTLTSGSDEEDPSTQIRGQSPGGVVFESGYANNDPSVLWPAQTPPTYQPYPAISPYYSPNVARTTTFNRDGLWFKDMLYKNRDYFFTMEYLMVRYRNPGNEVVGTRPAPFFRNDPGASTGGGAGNAGNLTGGLIGVPVYNHGLAGPGQFGLFVPPGTGRIDVGPGAFPFPFVVQNVNFTVNAVADETLFPIRSLGHFDNPFKTDGMRLRWGFENEDESGLMVTGWFGTRDRDRFQFGRDAIHGVVIDQAFLLANSPTGGQSPVFPRNGSLPIKIRDDILSVGGQGDLVSTGFSGVSQKYDVMFKYEVASFAAGGAVHLYHEPVFKRNWVSVRPTFGARYQYLAEQFNFRGIDSGFGYDLNFGSGGGGGGGANNNQAPLFRPDTADIVIPLDNNGQTFFLDSRVESDIDSHMGGGEAGLRYDFGSGKSFSIWGQSTFGLLANHQRIQLEGDKIGDPILYFLATGDNFTDDSIGLDTDFFEETDHTVVSPMFEQSVFFDIDIFRHIPVLKNLHALESAKFRTGYTYTVIGNVSRPAESIDWRGFPDFPTIRGDTRKTWSTHNWSFAVDWTF